jgi:hypothetical protein
MLLGFCEVIAVNVFNEVDSAVKFQLGFQKAHGEKNIRLK